MLDNRYAILFIRGELPVMDLKYDILKHPNVVYTADGKGGVYQHGEVTKNVATIYNKFKGYTLADCDCRYCLYYGGRRKSKIICLVDGCVCADEIRQAKKMKERSS